MLRKMLQIGVNMLRNSQQTKHPWGQHAPEYRAVQNRERGQYAPESEPKPNFGGSIPIPGTGYLPDWQSK